MESIYDYRNGTLIKIQLKTQKRVAFQSMKQKFTPIDIKFPVYRPMAWLKGRWLIELRADTVYLREVENASEDDCIVISCEQADVGATLYYTDVIDREQNKTFCIDKIEVYPNAVLQIKVTERDNQPPSSNPEPHNAVSNSGQQTASSAELAEVKKKLARQEEKNNALTEQINLLREGVSAQSAATLKNLIKQKDLLDSETEQQIHKIEELTESTRKLEEERDKRQQSIDKLRAEAESLKSCLEHMKDELDELKALRDFYELNCDEANHMVEEYKARYELDEVTVALIEDDSFMKKKSISSAFDEVRKLIEAIEHRIELVVGFKTRYNSEVSDMHNQDGRISVESEIFHVDTEQNGDEENGDGETAAAADEGAAQ